MTRHVVRGGGPDNYPGGAAWLASGFRSRAELDRVNDTIGFRTFRVLRTMAKQQQLVRGGGWGNGDIATKVTPVHRRRITADESYTILGFRTFLPWRLTRT